MTDDDRRGHVFEIEWAPIADVRPHPENPRTGHNVEAIKKSIQVFGWRQPLVVDRDGYIVVGHGRYYAALELGHETVPIHRATDMTDDEARAYRIADNRANETSTWDEDKLIADLQRLADVPDLQFDIDAVGFDQAEIDKLLNPPPAKEPRPSLADRFVVPPFTVLDTRQGYWAERRRQWLALGIMSEMGRGDARAFGEDIMRGENDRLAADQRSNVTGAPPMPDYSDIGMANMAPGTSIFDPVLCECVYRWFAPRGGIVLDPFAGGSVRGVVAAALGLDYGGIELRQEQVEANVQQWQAIAPKLTDVPEAPSRKSPGWMPGDSRRMIELIGEPASVGGTIRPADLIFTCPPYYDLERYSDDPQDLSTMDPAGFRQAYTDIVVTAAKYLADDRFAVVVVSNVRAPDGTYRDLVGDTVDAMTAAGLRFYNEAVLVNPAGSLPIRVARQFTASRKLGRTHQSILVFVKGDGKRATEACGEIVVEDLPVEAADADD